MQRQPPARARFVPSPRIATLSGWRWPQWLMLGVASLLVASYLHLLSWGWVETAIHRLGAQASVQGAFGDPASGRLSAMFTVFAFLLLTPFGALAGLFVLALTVAIAANVLSLLVGRLGITEGGCRIAVVAALAGLAYAEKAVWLPVMLWTLGLVARAYLVLVE